MRQPSRSRLLEALSPEDIEARGDNDAELEESSFEDNEVKGPIFPRGARELVEFVVLESTCRSDGGGLVRDVFFLFFWQV